MNQPFSDLAKAALQVSNDNNIEVKDVPIQFVIIGADGVEEIYLVQMMDSGDGKLIMQFSESP